MQDAERLQGLRSGPRDPSAWKRLVWLVVTTVRRYDEDNGPLAAAAVAFYGLLSLGPLVLFVTSMAGLVIGHENARQEISAQLTALVGDTASAAVDRLAHDLGSKAGELGFFSALVTAYGGTRLFIHLQTALNQVWNVQLMPAKGVRGHALRLIGRRALSMAIIVVLGVLLLLTVASSAVLSVASRFLPDLVRFPLAFRVAEFAGSFAVTTLVFAAMYAVIPDAKVKVKYVWPGAAIAAGLFVAGKIALGVYFAYSGIGSIDGTATALVVVLFWASFSANLFLLGAEFTEVYTEMSGDRIEPRSYAARDA